jgi:hypothetical protein
MKPIAYVSCNDKSERVPFGGFFAVQIGSPGRDVRSRRLDAGVMSKAYESEESLRGSVFFSTDASRMSGTMWQYGSKRHAFYLSSPPEIVEVVLMRTHKSVLLKGLAFFGVVKGGAKSRRVSD